MATGLSRETREAVYARDGYSCVRCFRTSGLSVHHRRPRGMGGTSLDDVHHKANLITLHGDGVTGCHGWVESHRTLAYALGYLCPSWEDPEAWPVYRGRGVWQQPGESWTPAQPQPGQSAEPM